MAAAHGAVGLSLRAAPLLSAIDAAAADNDQKCEANFYVGEWHLLKGDVVSARKRFEQAFAGCPSNLMERDMAAIEAKRLPGERGASR